MHFIFYNGDAIKKTMPSTGVTSFGSEGVTVSGIVFFRFRKGRFVKEHPVDRPWRANTRDGGFDTTWRRTPTHR